MISTERLQQALTYLAETDEQEAKLKALVEKNKRKMDAMFTTIAAHTKGTVLEREAAAYGHADYISARDAYLLALSEHGAVKNKRATECIIVDVWRSLNAARNKGQIV